MRLVRLLPFPTLLSTAVCLVTMIPPLCARALPYSSEAVIAANTLDASIQPTIMRLINENPLQSDVSKARQTFCGQRIKPLSAGDDSVKRAVVDTKLAVTTELLFEKTSDAPPTAIDNFSFVVEFSQYRVLARHSQPRFTSDAAGFSIPLSKQATRAVRFEGKLGADIVVLVPPVEECGVQAIAICPRRYEKIDRLIQAPYQLKAARLLVDAKAEGIRAPLKDNRGKVQASIRSSSNLTLPQSWFEEASGGGTISAKKSYAHNRNAPHTLPSFTPLPSLPWRGSYEARVELGTVAEALRASHKVTTTEIGTGMIAEQSDLQMGKSEYFVQGGSCYTVVQWTDEVV